MGQLIVVGLLLLIAAATPLAHGQLVTANVTGRLCCTPTGNCVAGSVGLSGVTVFLNCTNLLGTVVQTLGQTITSSNGNFTITVSNSTLQNILGSCKIVVSLPPNNVTCPVLNTATGFLSGVLVLIGQVPGIVGGLLNVILGVLTFVHVGVGVVVGAGV